MAILQVLKDAEALKQGLRTAIAGASAFLLAEYLALPQGYWSVITAIMITQESVGATLEAVRDRLIGTFAGAVIGFLLAVATPSGEWGTLVAMVISTGLLAIFAARYPSLRIAPMTAAIMLIATPSHADVVISASHRVSEILLGCIVGIGMQLLIFPQRAETLLRAKVAQALSLMAEFLLADQRASVVQLDRDLQDVHRHMDKLVNQVEVEHFGKVRGRGLEPTNVNHALRRLRFAVATLHRVTHRAAAGHDAAAAAKVQAVNRAVHAYLLELSSEVNATGPAASVEGIDEAYSRFLASSSTTLREADAAGAEIVSSYRDAYEQTRIALDELRSAIFGTTAGGSS